MDYIKEAFQKVKEDINNLNFELNSIKEELNEIQNSILQLFSLLDSKTNSSTDRSYNSAFRQINKTSNSPTINSFNENLLFKDYKQGIITSSSGNKGVSTDRQTDQQTDTSTGNNGVISSKDSHNIRDSISKTSTILNQLDEIKRELRLKIKKLTNQEMLVLSTIYQLEDQGHLVDYSLLSNYLNLTQSSIRDYVQRISLKGIPLTKEKINNKRIILHISEDFRKLASLNTLISLRDI